MQYSLHQQQFSLTTVTFTLETLIRDANGNIIKDEFVVTDKANANKDAKEEAKAVKAAEQKAPAAAKADAKALPNTAAVK